MEGLRTSSNFVTSLLRFHALRSKTNTVNSGKFGDCFALFSSLWSHCVVMKMSEAVRASFVVEAYQFEPILTESDRESCDDDSVNSDNGGHDMNED